MFNVKEFETLQLFATMPFLMLSLYARSSLYCLLSKSFYLIAVFFSFFFFLDVHTCFNKKVKIDILVCCVLAFSYVSLRISVMICFRIKTVKVFR